MIVNIPMGLKRIRAIRQLMSRFRATMTGWLFEYAKKHMSKHALCTVRTNWTLEQGLSFVTHRNENYRDKENVENK